MGSKEVTGVQTLNRSLYGKKATIVAAGCWSGSLMHELLKDCNISMDVPVKPRKVRLSRLILAFYLPCNHSLPVQNELPFQISVIFIIKNSGKPSSREYVKTLVFLI